MKMVNANGNSFLDSYLKSDKVVSVPKTMKDERQELEQKAVQHEANRKVQASKYANADVSSETSPGYRAEITDEPKVVQKASSVLKDFIGDLVGKGGFVISNDEFRSVKASNDKIDDSKITEKALASFNVKFTLPGLNSYRTAKFIVSYNVADHSNYKVENTFYTEANKDVQLTKENLENYLKAAEKEETKMSKGSKPIAWFDPSVEGYNTIETVETSEKVVARLKSAGYSVNPSFWVDASVNPEKFGRVCYFVEVPLNKTEEFKKIASMSDDLWFNRTDEKNTTAPYKHKDDEWTDRASEKGAQDSGNLYSYTEKDYKNGKDWIARTEEKGPKGNPYTSGKEMFRDESKKTPATNAEVVKTVIAKNDAQKSTLNDIDELINLLK